MGGIPEIFNQPGALFVLLPRGKKFPPIHKGWELPKNGHSCAKARRHPGNVGILALAGGKYGGLDQDDLEAFQGLQLGATTMWETRPGRLGYWLRWADDPAEVLPKFDFKEDQAQIYLYKKGAQVGEVKLQRSYQVIPPSFKFINSKGEDVPPGAGGQRVDYKLLDSSPPAEIYLEGLLRELQKIGITFSGKKKEEPSRLEANAAKLEGMAREGRQRRAESEESRARKYAEAALQDEVLKLAGTAEGSRNDQLNRSAFALGQFVAAGILSEMEVSRALSKAGSYAGLTLEETEATIKSGLEAGKRTPREIPDAEARVRADPGRELGGEDKEISENELKDLPKSFNPKLDLHLEPSNFISKYMAYAKTTSDAYEEYHFASELVLLSVAADRQIVISMRHGDIYPNIWIFPIGDSTVSRKTTAHKLCKLILKTKYPKKSLPSSFSPEALMDAISSTPRCFYLKDEAGSLLASLCKDYMAETRDFLAEIYECDDYYRKLKKSECLITDPYITQYLMTTPDNLKEYTSALDLTSGWLLRYLWMYPNYPKEWRAFAEKDGSDFEKYTTIYGEYNLVVDKLATPRRLSMTAESMQFFQEWQRGIEEAAMENADNITKALAGRLMTHAVKMAALFTVGREDFDENSKIELPHIREAARLVVEYFLPIGRIIIEEVARAESKNVQDKIIGTIKRWNGLISQRDLLRALHLPLKDVELAIDALVKAEEIERVSIQSKKGSKLCYALIKSETKECHSDIVSHKVVYKENNEGDL